MAKEAPVGGNAARVRQFAQAYNDEEWEELAALCSPDVVFWTFLEGRAEPDALRGAEGIQRWRESEDEVLETRRLEVNEVTELGSGRVLVSASVTGRFRGSGVDLSSEAAWLFHLRDDGAIASFRSFQSRADALAAAGSSSPAI